jgi:hypothetical protein
MQHTLALDTEKAREAGYLFSKVEDWLPGLIGMTTLAEKRNPSLS